jgi:hypothetical protein
VERAAGAGNKINIWDVSGNVPTLIDSLIVAGATTTGDVAVTDDGSLLIVATERSGGSIVTYDLADPRHRRLSRFTNAETDPGVHAAEIGRVNGKLYGFLSIDPIGSTLARLVVVDLNTSGAAPSVQQGDGEPVRPRHFLDGLLFVALWNDGMEIWDVGGCGAGASPESPRVLGGVKTIDGEVHNIGGCTTPLAPSASRSLEKRGRLHRFEPRGDIHVVEITDPTKPKEVAFYHVDGAGTHNFSVDETTASCTRPTTTAAFARSTFEATWEHVRRVSRAQRGGESFPVRFTSNGSYSRSTGAPPRTMYAWGVQYLGGSVYVSDMVNGIEIGAAK